MNLTTAVFLLSTDFVLDKCLIAIFDLFAKAHNNSHLLSFCVVL